jgi:hypothetical protein
MKELPMPVSFEEIENFLMSAELTTGDAEPMQVMSLSIDTDAYIFESNIVVHEDVSLRHQPIWVKGNAHFKGGVRNAFIVVLGTVKFDSECVDTRVYSLGNGYFHITRDSHITSLGEIHLAVQSETTNFLAAEHIFADNANIRGGRLAATNDISVGIANSLGERQKLTITSGDRKLSIRKVQMLASRLQILEDDFKSIKEIVQNLVKTLIARNMISKKIPQLDILKQRQTDMEKHLTEQRTMFQTLESEMLKPKRPGVIRVISKIGGDVTILIDGINYDTINEMKELKFAVTGSEIIPLTLNE